MTVDTGTVSRRVPAARDRLLVFLAGSAVLPWLAASLTTLVFTAVADAIDDAAPDAFGNTARGMLSIEYLLVPVLVFAVLAGVVAARHAGRLPAVFGQFWAVGGVVAVVSAVVTIAYLMVLDPAYGFAVAAFGGMFTGYWLYAFFAGALLWRWSAPARNAVGYPNLP